MVIQTDEQREGEIERRVQERVATALRGMTELVDTATEKAMRRVLADEMLRREFGAVLYEELETHFSTNLARWMFRHVMRFIATAVIGGLLTWAVLTGGTGKHQ